VAASGFGNLLPAESVVIFPDVLALSASDWNATGSGRIHVYPSV
jgi:hypothetical protein